MKTKTTKKLYTVSDMVFSSLKDAEKQINQWQKMDSLSSRAKVFEITGVCYRPKMKLVKEKYDKRD